MMLFAEGPAFLLAYGQFRSTTLSGMWAEFLPHLARGLIPVLLLYAVASLVTERRHCRFLGAALYFFGAGLLLPTFAVMGAYGPAHMALSVTGRATGVLFICILVKALLTPPRPESVGTRTLCSHCGYDVSECAAGRCSECGYAFPTNVTTPIVKPDA
ncbi:MAG: hypothetical protein U0636_05205 [Phycisphaerales bacterium]